MTPVVDTSARRALSTLAQPTAAVMAPRYPPAGKPAHVISWPRPATPRMAARPSPVVERVAAAFAPVVCAASWDPGAITTIEAN
ncbi:MAG: hypothetical protein M3Y48_24430 [Actinomycetota bacterium]|nr:hypothetical protein [Actinomycetota bacterium]